MALQVSEHFRLGHPLQVQLGDDLPAMERGHPFEPGAEVPIGLRHA
jgi:hypothetical protein